MSFKKFSYHEHAMTSDREDFWGQVKRTVNGKPFSEEQIALIVEAIRRGLALAPDDRVLDIGCGNGALSDRVFADCRGGVGIDISAYMIDVAQSYFGGRAGARYATAGAGAFIASSDDTAFSKLLCYGSFMYFTDDEAAEILAGLRRRYPLVTRCFLGNLPDRDRIDAFKERGGYVAGIEDSHETAIGLWRSESRMRELAERSGWSAAVLRMPPEFNASVYRYDVVLTPRAMS